MRQRKPKLDRLGPAIKNAGVAMPAFIGATYFRNFVFLGIVAKDLERAHVRAHAATNAFGPVDDWGHIRFLLSKTVFSEVGASGDAVMRSFFHNMGECDYRICDKTQKSPSWRMTGFLYYDEII